jgi:hypothetical protein
MTYALKSKISAQEYGQYLIGIVWRKRRAEFLDRYRWCEECYIKPADQIHHLTYLHIGNEPDEDLVAVCRPCHEKLHNLRAANDNQPMLPFPDMKKVA